MLMFKQLKTSHFNADDQDANNSSGSDSFDQDSGQSPFDSSIHSAQTRRAGTRGHSPSISSSQSHWAGARVSRHPRRPLPATTYAIPERRLLGVVRRLNCGVERLVGG